MFKKGDKVVCIRDDKFDEIAPFIKILTNNKIYEVEHVIQVIDQSMDKFFVIVNCGHNVKWKPNRFISIKVEN